MDARANKEGYYTRQEVIEILDILNNIAPVDKLNIDESETLVKRMEAYPQFFGSSIEQFKGDIFIAKNFERFKTYSPIVREFYF